MKQTFGLLQQLSQHVPKAIYSVGLPQEPIRLRRTKHGRHDGGFVNQKHKRTQTKTSFRWYFLPFLPDPSFHVTIFSFVSTRVAIPKFLLCFPLSTLQRLFFLKQKQIGARFSFCKRVRGSYRRAIHEIYIYSSHCAINHLDFVVPEQLK